MAIKLTEAMMCLNCDAIYAESESAGSGRPAGCPVCGSKCAWPLSRWIRPVYLTPGATSSETGRQNKRRVS